VLEKISRLFTGERTFFHLLLVVAGLIAVLKGIRTPYSWAATQAQIDYRDGFLRRGLFGEICRVLHIPIWNYGVFTLVSFLLLGICLALLIWSVFRSGLDMAGLGSLSALVAGSFCITYLVNVVGYFDVLMLLMVLIVFTMPSARWQIVTALVFGVAGVLLHELYAIAFLPVSLVVPVCWAAQDRKPARVAAIALALLVPVILFFVLAHRPELSQQQVTVLGQQMQRRINFRAYTPMLNVLWIPPSDTRSYMLSLMSIRTWWVVELFGLLAFLPTTLFFFALAWRWAKPLGRMAQSYLVPATFAPLLLNFAGYDRYRWLMMMTLDAIACAIAVSWYRSRTGDPVGIVSVGWRRAAVLLLAVNLATTIGFFVGNAQGFPFENYWWAHHSASRHSDLRHLQPSDSDALNWSAEPQERPHRPQ
jgi:hypothetical protein